MKRQVSKQSRYGLNATARLLGLILCLMTSAANAAIHACKQPDGSVAFQDSACAVKPKPSAKTPTQTDKIPFSIDASWFDRPPVTPDRAVCTKAGCHCGMFSRKYKSGLPLAIADALYIDGNWHRLELTLMELELPNKNAFELSELRKERDEAACNILMSQKTLRIFGDDVMLKLREKKRYAEERGLDNPDDCDAGDDLACTYTELIQIYDRIQGDIKALRRNSRIADDEETINNLADSDSL